MINIWKYRGFIKSSVFREFQARYQGSLLGLSWTVLNPLAMILVYTLIFSQLMKARIPGSDVPYAYSIFLIAGILPWGLMSEMLTRGQSVFLDNANVIKKVNVPKLCFPLISLFNALINFAIIFFLFLIFLVVVDRFPTHAFWAFFPVIALQISFTFALGVILGVLNVFFRDVGQFIGIFLQFWFWLTPIVYSATVLPTKVLPYLSLNPMAPLVDAYQLIFLQNIAPNWSSLVPIFCLALLLNVIAWRMYKRFSGEMVDEL
jgi:lipopolysaccharide transport system permease protein